MAHVEHRPLILVTDPALLDRVLGLAGSVGVEPLVVIDHLAAAPHWLQAPIVIVDEPAAQACARAQMAWRPGVVLLAAWGRHPDQQTWAAASALAVDHVVHLPDAASWLTRRLAAPPVQGTRTPVACVLPGTGGAGASLLAIALALTAVHEGRSTLLIDADPLGAGLDVTLATEQTPGARWPTLAPSAAASGEPGGALYDALPRRGELSLLTWPPGQSGSVAPSLLDDVLDSAEARHAGLVVLDLPRYPSALAEAALRRADLSLLVVPAELRSVHAAVRTTTTLLQQGARPECVARASSTGALAPHEVAAALELPLAGELEHDRRLVRALERSELAPTLLRGSHRRLSSALLRRVDELVPGGVA